MLTPKQEKFVRNLVDGMSQYDAYRNSYNAENMKRSTIDRRATELAAKSTIKARYNELIEKANEKVEIKAEDILRELKAIAFSNGTDYAEIKNNKLLFKNTGELDEDKKKAISTIKQTREGKSIETYDKLKAIDMLVKYMKLFDNADNETSTPSLKIIVTDNSNLEKVLYEEEEKWAME